MMTASAMVCLLLRSGGRILPAVLGALSGAGPGPARASTVVAVRHRLPGAASNRATGQPTRSGWPGTAATHPGATVRP